jgi:hypothetical protein
VTPDVNARLLVTKPQLPSLRIRAICLETRLRKENASCPPGNASIFLLKYVRISADCFFTDVFSHKIGDPGNTGKKN